MQFPRKVDPEVLAEVINLMEACGYITVEDNPNNPNEVIVRAAPRLVQTLERLGITKDNYREHFSTTI